MGGFSRSFSRCSLFAMTHHPACGKHAMHFVLCYPTQSRKIRRIGVKECNFGAGSLFTTRLLLRAVRAAAQLARTQSCRVHCIYMQARAQVFRWLATQFSQDPGEGSEKHVFRCTPPTHMASKIGCTHPQTRHATRRARWELQGNFADRRPLAFTAPAHAVRVTTVWAKIEFPTQITKVSTRRPDAVQAWRHHTLAQW